MLIKTKVFPDSKKESVIQKETDFFEVRVKAEAKQGEANKAVMSALSKFFNVSVSHIKIVKGAKSRNKVFEIRGVKSQIEKAVEVLKNGGIIAYPTDTVYGIGGNAFDNKVVQRILDLKGRSEDRALLVAVSDFKMMAAIVFITEKEKRFMEKFLPGPVAFILPKKSRISDLVTGGKNTVGIRMPDNKEALEIIRRAGFPIISTSANISGRKPAVKSADIDLEADFMVEGKCKHKKPSTIVDLVNKAIIREGAESEGVKKALKAEFSLQRYG
ncbi:MAG: threonylcarbamoyl-AMP synthase [Parcubacteria group bacterium CG08_land_8_20_14_0_20_43_9]|nr:MAG: threonylcarbamoyl-AMP synthase [Parcubacteria group bacterium CG08_land_8_20_14_0_20_43_9]